MKKKIGKRLFYFLVKELKKRENGVLKITLYKNRSHTPDGNHGEYMDNHMALALGKKNKAKNWYQNIATLAHEYAHHIHEKIRNPSFNEKTYFATYILYSAYATKKERIKCGKITMLDEYQADSDGYKVLKDFSVHNLFKDWWRMANWYNLRIKFFIENGVLIEEIEPPKILSLSNKKYTKKQVLKPVAKKHRKILWSLIESRKIKFSVV